MEDNEQNQLETVDGKEKPVGFLSQFASVLSEHTSENKILATCVKGQSEDRRFKIAQFILAKRIVLLIVRVIALLHFMG